MFIRIKNLREDNDLTGEEVAKVLGCSRRNYTNIENGTSLISSYQAILLASFYNRKIEYLLGLSDDNSYFKINKDKKRECHKIIRELRIKNGLSQKELCAIVNCSQSVYSRYENRKIICNLNILIVLSKYYNVSLDYILGIIKKE